MDTPQDKQPEKHGKKEQKNALGISRGIYAVGYSFKDALIWGAGVSAALVVPIYMLRDSGPVKWMINKLSSKHENSWRQRLSEKFPKIGPVLAVSLMVGYVVSHIVQIPSSVRGWKQAQGAVDKYNTLEDEKTQLVEHNSLLQEDNDKLKAALAAGDKNRAPFTDRTRAEAAAAGIGRGG